MTKGAREEGGTEQWTSGEADRTRTGGAGEGLGTVTPRLRWRSGSSNSEFRLHTKHDTCVRNLHGKTPSRAHAATVPPPSPSVSMQVIISATVS